MKKTFTVFWLFLCFIIPFQTIDDVFAKPIRLETAGQVAGVMLSTSGKSAHFQPGQQITLAVENEKLAFIFILQPRGYIVVTADTDLPPIVAYSFTGEFGENDLQKNILLQILKTDLELRHRNISNLPREMLAHRKRQWERSSDKTLQASQTFEQWPPAGTTTTEGWVETNWGQEFPYNRYCPLDTVTMKRSLAGCPSIAMSQILNYHQSTNNTFFDSTDQYVHNFAGRQFHFDADYQSHRFPSFAQLNTYLERLLANYRDNKPLRSTDKAALVFACGLAAKQVYTSDVSGTFNVGQSHRAYLRFNCPGTELLSATSLNLFDRISQNVKDALPVHLAMMTPQRDAGHHVVVDGYNTDNYFHLNFGWSGLYDGWYLLPDEMPYSLTVVEGAIVDISLIPAGVRDKPEVAPTVFSLRNFPNPFNNTTTISFHLPKTSSVTLEIFNLTGQKVCTFLQEELKAAGQFELKWDGADDFGRSLASGIYFVKLSVGRTVLSNRILLLK